jgi:hypothetical protein
MILASWAIWLIIVAAVLGIAWVVVKQMGIPIPAWVGQILGIIFLAIVGVLAIKFLLSVV